MDPPRVVVCRNPGSSRVRVVHSDVKATRSVRRRHGGQRSIKRQNIGLHVGRARPSGKLQAARRVDPCHTRQEHGGGGQQRKRRVEQRVVARERAAHIGPPCVGVVQVVRAGLN